MIAGTVGCSIVSPRREQAHEDEHGRATPPPSPGTSPPSPRTSQDTRPQARHDHEDAGAALAADPAEHEELQADDDGGVDREGEPDDSVETSADLRAKAGNPASIWP